MIYQKIPYFPRTLDWQCLIASKNQSLWHTHLLYGHIAEIVYVFSVLSIK